MAPCVNCAKTLRARPVREKVGSSGPQFIQDFRDEHKQITQLVQAARQAAHAVDPLKPFFESAALVHARLLSRTFVRSKQIVYDVYLLRVGGAVFSSQRRGPRRKSPFHRARTAQRDLLVLTEG